VTNDRQKVTVDRQHLKNLNGSMYLLIPSRIKAALNLSEEHIAAFEREVLDGGELGRLTIRIERPSDKRDVN
jgi:hypothetical protein